MDTVDFHFERIKSQINKLQSYLNDLKAEVQKAENTRQRHNSETKQEIEQLRIQAGLGD